MNPAAHAWWDFGYAGVFACVFLEQIGVPIPAFPALLGAGALVASGDMNLGLCLIVAVASALAADMIWYGIGRVRGGKVLNLMCKLSWRPDTCVTKTKAAFSQHGTKTLLIAKFVPGLSTLTPPLAGITQVPVSRFVFFDATGSLLWAIVPLVAGASLQRSFAMLEAKAYALIPYLPYICGTLIVAVLAWRYIGRQRYMKTLRKELRASFSPEELRRMLTQGRPVTVLDVRDELSLKENPAILPGATWIPYGALENRFRELPTDEPIVAYCDCPEDQAAVAAVELLHQKGLKEARPLHGGLDGWTAKGFSTETLPVPA